MQPRTLSSSALEEKMKLAYVPGMAIASVLDGAGSVCVSGVTSAAN